MTKVELFELIRRGHQLEGKSIRALALSFRVHRRLVRAALENAVPVPRKTSVRNSPKLGPYLHLIEKWLKADLKAPRKQRHTAHRIWERLTKDHDCQAAESSVRQVVRRMKRELGLQAGAAFVPQIHLPGEEAEVDFYESHVAFPDGQVKLYHFCMRACHSGREIHIAFPQLTQQAFLEAHATAFAYFGGVFKLIRYDNLTAAVQKVLKGHRRVETDRFVAMRSHYLFESVFCKVGIAGAHEKGGVENGQGRFRRNHLVPVPVVESLEAYNAYLLECCAKDDQRVMAQRQQSVWLDWLTEVPALRSLPTSPFETDLVSMGMPDQHGRVRVAGNRYSVPIALHGRRVEVRLGAKSVRFHHGGALVATHDRLIGQGRQSLQLDHYLDVLRHRPGAMQGSIPLAQVRARGDWPAAYDRFWEALKERHGSVNGTVEMVEVLMLHREMPRDTVLVAVESALELGCLSAEAIRQLTRHLEDPVRQAAPLRDLGDLAQYDVPVPTLDMFAALVGEVPA